MESNAMVVSILAGRPEDAEVILDSVRVAGSEGIVYSSWRDLVTEAEDVSCDAMIVELVALGAERQEFLDAKSEEALVSIPLIFITYPDGSGPSSFGTRRAYIAAWLRHPPKVQDICRALAGLLERPQGYV
jgi:hypothetical protein